MSTVDETVTSDGSDPLGANIQTSVYIVNQSTPVTGYVLARVNGSLVRTGATVQISAGDQVIAYTPASATRYSILSAGVLGYMPGTNTSTLQFVDTDSNVSVGGVVGDGGE